MTFWEEKLELTLELKDHFGSCGWIFETLCTLAFIAKGLAIILVSSDNGKVL